MNELTNNTEIKIKDEFLLLPLSTEELPHRCVFCNETENTKHIKTKITAKQISKKKLTKLEYIYARDFYAYDTTTHRDATSASARMIIRKLQFIFALGYIYLFIITPFSQIFTEESLYISLAILYLLVLYSLVSHENIRPFTYTLCYKHLRIKRLVIFFSWFFFLSGLAAILINIIFFEAKVENIQLSFIPIYISLFIDFKLNRFVVPLYMVAKNESEFVILGAGEKFLNSFKNKVN